MPVTGQAVLDLAKLHAGETYVLGARAPMANADYKGPWDCAEFASWCVYRASGVLFGVRPDHDPILADAYTGYWAEESVAAGCRIGVEEAIATPGALLLRAPSSRLGGHIAISDGTGSTMEAHSTAKGVDTFSALGRRWDCGVLVPGIRYFRSDAEISAPPMPHVLRVSEPLMRGPSVEKVQRALQKLGYMVGAIDGIYGPQTAAAVVAFQNEKGIVPDGEVGAATRTALGI